MDTPIEILTRELNLMRFVSTRRGFSPRKREAKAIVPLLEEAIEKLTPNPNQKMKFKDLPIGARFKYPNLESVWVKLNSHPKSMFNEGDGLICSWNEDYKLSQNFCSFVDAENNIDYDTEVVVV